MLAWHCRSSDSSNWVPAYDVHAADEAATPPSRLVCRWRRLCPRRGRCEHPRHCALAQLVLRRPQNLDEVTTPAPEDEDIAAERILLRCSLDLRREPLEFGAHVCDAGRDLDASARRQTDHRDRISSFKKSYHASDQRGRK